MAPPKHKQNRQIHEHGGMCKQDVRGCEQTCGCEIALRTLTQTIGGSVLFQNFMFVCCVHLGTARWYIGKWEFWTKRFQRCWFNLLTLAFAFTTSKIRGNASILFGKNPVLQMFSLANRTHIEMFALDEKCVKLFKLAFASSIF